MSEHRRRTMPGIRNSPQFDPQQDGRTLSALRQFVSSYDLPGISAALDQVWRALESHPDKSLDSRILTSMEELQADLGLAQTLGIIGKLDSTRPEVLARVYTENNGKIVSRLEEYLRSAAFIFSKAARCVEEGVVLRQLDHDILTRAEMKAHLAADAALAAGINSQLSSLFERKTTRAQADLFSFFGA